MINKKTAEVTLIELLVVVAIFIAVSISQGSIVQFPSVSSENALFYIDMDKSSTIAVTPSGTLRGKVEGKAIKLVSGVQGKAGRFVNAVLEFPAQGNIDSKAGTVEMWIAPYWQRKDGKKHFFFTVYTSENDRFYLRVDEFNRPNVYYCAGGKGVSLVDFVADKDWRARQWHHISVAWDFSNTQNGKIYLYVDGKVFARREGIKNQGRIKITSGTKIRIGGYVGPANTADCDIDEIRIYDTFREPDSKITHFFESYRYYRYASYLKSRLEKALKQADIHRKTIDKIYSGRYASIRASAKHKLGLVRWSANSFSKIVPEKHNRNLHWGAVAAEELERLIIEAKVLQSRKSGNLPYFDALVVSSIEKVYREKYRFDWPIRRKLQLDMARNEYESLQVVVFPYAGSLRDVQVKLSPIVSQDGKILKTDEVSIRKVGYIRVEDEAGESHFYPDPLNPIDNDKTYVDYRKVQPFWITIKTSKDALPKLYNFDITVTAEDIDNVRHTSKVQVSVRVSPVVLPDTPSLKTAFGLTPTFLRMQHGLTSDEQVRQMADKYVRMMLKYKLSPKSFVRGKEYKDDMYFLQPKYILTKDRKIKIDWTEFDKQVKKYLPMGLNTILAGRRTWKGSFLVFNEVTGKEEYYKVKMFSDEYKRLLKQVFSQWEEHLKEKGWLEMGYTYVTDEPPASRFPWINHVHALVKKAAPNLKCMITMSPRDEIEIIDIWTPILNAITTKDIVREQQKGRHFWYYTCMGPLSPYPNFHIVQSSVAHRVALWFTYRFGGEGYLYWEVAYWPNRSPWEDTCWWLTARPCDGDGSLFYTGENGPIATIRLENIRDGIEDFEIMHTLESSIDVRKRQEMFKTLGIAQAYRVTSCWNNDPQMMIELRRKLLKAAEQSKGLIR